MFAKEYHTSMLDFVLRILKVIDGFKVDAEFLSACREKFKPDFPAISLAEYLRQKIFSIDLEGVLQDFKDEELFACRNILNSGGMMVQDINSNIDFNFTGYYFLEFPTEFPQKVFFNGKPVKYLYFTADLVEKIEETFDKLMVSYYSSSIFKKHSQRMLDSIARTNLSKGTLLTSLDTKIPKKIHVIWFGKPIAHGDLLSIYHLASHAKKAGYEMSFWTEKEIQVYKALYKQSKPIHEKDYDLDSSKSITNNYFAESITFVNFQIKNFSQIFTSDIIEFFQKKNEWESIKNLIYREKTGLKNFAAISDLARLLILFVEGGGYFDPDNLPQPFDKTFPKDLSQFHYQNPENLQYGFGCSENANTFFRNDIIFVAPKHPLIAEIISEMLRRYRQLDEKIVDIKEIKAGENKSEFHFRTAMDLKRSYFWGEPIDFHGKPKSDEACSYRRLLTINSSGPQMVAEVMKEFARKNHFDVNHLFVGSDFFDRNRLKRDAVGSWYKKPPEITSVSDEEVDYSVGNSESVHLTVSPITARYVIDL